MLLSGCVMGALAKLSDVYFRVSYFQMSLSELTSQMSIWIVLGVAISLFSGSRKLAMANVFLFCAGMLAAYYVTAELTHAVYGWTFIKGWAVFACCSPVMAYLVTLTKGRGLLPLLIKLGVLAVYIGIDLLLCLTRRIPESAWPYLSSGAGRPRCRCRRRRACRSRPAGPCRSGAWR